MKRMSGVMLGLACLLVALWLVAPTLVIVPMSFNEKKSLAFPPTGFSLQWYENFFSNPAWFGSFTTSLKIALIVAILATVLALNMIGDGLRDAVDPRLRRD